MRYVVCFERLIVCDANGLLSRLSLFGTAPPKFSSEVSSILPVSICGVLGASSPRCAPAKLFSLAIRKLTKYLRSLGKF